MCPEALARIPETVARCPSPTDAADVFAADLAVPVTDGRDVRAGRRATLNPATVSHHLAGAAHSRCG
jgi:hypothetical protein